RVVSMPSREWSADQDAAYREGVLPGSVTAARDRRGRRILRVHDIAGRDGIIVGIDGFGVSGALTPDRGHGVISVMPLP
ncbi:transketolase-like TK C-terminal-containing protein, partial [Microbacterium memoriense]